MATYPVRLFRLPYGPPPATPPPNADRLQPREELGFSVAADSMGQAKPVTRERLVRFGERIRTLSYTPGGGLIAVVYARS